MKDNFKIEPGQVLTEFKYKPVKLDKGYASRTLHIDIGNSVIESKPVTDEMKDLFIGGKGFDLRILWDNTSEKTRWNDPENTICISPGPLSGTTSYPGSGKSLVTCISPLTDIVIDSNVGGHFGPFLKFSGWDALAVSGKAPEDVFILIDGRKHKVTIQKMTSTCMDSHILCELITDHIARKKEDKQYVSVVATGSGSDHTYFGMLNFSFYDWRRNEVRFKQAGRGGIGTVFRDKKILAIAVLSDEWKPKWSITVESQE